MSENLKKLEVKAKTGKEKFTLRGKEIEIDLLSFWRWSTSDLVSNATRGVLAEFIVAQALGIPKYHVRQEWDAYDLETTEGIKVEVKSAAYLQSWHQKSFSKISFNVQKKRSWDAKTNEQEEEPTRPANVYVFALLAHKDKATVDPMNLDQWQFYVLPTRVLDERKRSQHSITLKSLEKLCSPISFSELKKAVEKDYIEHHK